MPNDTFGLELLALRRDLGLTQAEFAQMTGFSLRAISAWETGERIPKKRNIQEIHRLCAKYAQEPQHTQNKKLSEAPDPTFTDKGKLPYNSGVKLKDGDSREGSVPVGVYAFAGAGGPMELFEHEPIQTVDIPKHWLKPDMQSVLIRGRSMEPSIIDGAVVGVDTQDKNVVSGELYAVWLEYEGAVVKRLYMERDIVRICSDNPAFKEMQIKNDEINGDTFILGKVCWLMQSY